MTTQFISAHLVKGSEGRHIHKKSQMHGKGHNTRKGRWIRSQEDTRAWKERDKNYFIEPELWGLLCIDAYSHCACDNSFEVKEDKNALYIMLRV